MTKRNPWPRGALLVILLVCLLGRFPKLLAQQPGKVPAPPTAQTKSATDVDATGSQRTPDSSVPKDDRILWTLPNFLTVENASSMPPLTAAEKFMLITKDTFDPVTFIGLEAGINQASNTNPTFREGFRGYAKRYGLAFTDNAVGNFMTSAVFPVALHQDPRFYQMGTGGFLHRAWYAGTRVLVTRSDS
jgi:hypothetical protein